MKDFTRILLHLLSAKYFSNVLLAEILDDRLKRRSIAKTILMQGGMEPLLWRYPLAMKTSLIEPNYFIRNERLSKFFKPPEYFMFDKKYRVIHIGQSHHLSRFPFPNLISLLIFVMVKLQVKLPGQSQNKTQKGRWRQSIEEFTGCFEKGREAFLRTKVSSLKHISAQNSVFCFSFCF